MAKQTGCGPKCLILKLLAIVLMALGLWVGITGIMMQLALIPFTRVILWYLGAFLLFCIAKHLKMMACGMCKV